MKEKQESENHQTIENSISSPETELSENNSEVYKNLIEVISLFKSN